VVPKPLCEHVGKAELKIQSGPDRRQVLARLPGADLQHKIGAAERKANAANGTPV
jgi:hypothetical protein